MRPGTACVTASREADSSVGFWLHHRLPRPETPGVHLGGGDRTLQFKQAPGASLSTRVRKPLALDPYPGLLPRTGWGGSGVLTAREPQMDQGGLDLTVNTQALPGMVSHQHHLSPGPGNSPHSTSATRTPPAHKPQALPPQSPARPATSCPELPICLPRPSGRLETQSSLLIPARDAGLAPQAVGLDRKDSSSQKPALSMSPERYGGETCLVKAAV